MHFLFLIAALTQETSDDARLEGYVAAVLEREFRFSTAQVKVKDGVVTLSGRLPEGSDREHIVRSLLRVKGVRRVDFEPGPDAPSPPAESPGWSFFPDWRLFAPLLADPRDPHFSAAYRYNAKEDRTVKQAAAVSFGEFFGLAGYDGGPSARFEVGLQAGVFAVFDLEADSFDLINADYLIGVPVAFESGPFSARLRGYHQSSHLGDEFVLREAVDRVNLSYEALDLKSSFVVGPLRFYAGGGYLVHRDPSDLDPGSAQAGLEFEPHAGALSGSVSPLVALDLQWHAASDWALDISARFGIAFENPDRGRRRVLLLIEAYHGRNPDGQFYDQRVETVGVGVHVYF